MSPETTTHALPATYPRSRQSARLVILDRSTPRRAADLTGPFSEWGSSEYTALDGRRQSTGRVISCRHLLFHDAPFAIYGIFLKGRMGYSVRYKASHSRPVTRCDLDSVAGVFQPVDALNLARERKVPRFVCARLGLWHRWTGVDVPAGGSIRTVPWPRAPLQHQRRPPQLLREIPAGELI